MLPPQPNLPRGFSLIVKMVSRLIPGYDCVLDNYLPVLASGLALDADSLVVGNYQLMGVGSLPML